MLWLGKWGACAIGYFSDLEGGKADAAQEKYLSVCLELYSQIPADHLRW